MKMSRTVLSRILDAARTQGCTVGMWTQAGRTGWRHMSTYTEELDDKKKVPSKSKRRTTTGDIHKLYQSGTKITMLTAHDLVTAQACDHANIDITLVGDSLAMVSLGFADTTSVTMEEMLHHCRIVSRGCYSSFLVGDMPFGSYQSSVDNAVDNAVRFVKEGNMQGVKLEGGALMAPTVKRVVDAGVPVLGHVGLTPQSANVLGGFKVQGKTALSAKQLLKDALAIQEAGAFAMVIEAVPSPIASFITDQLSIPTIGIGAGPHTSGQVLVTLDMLGIFDRFTPKFCRQYANLAPLIQGAVEQYVKDVKEGRYPPDHDD
eukprot:comp21520_c0_seq1/m.29909 comp21520_c0_seq1/g.29909  ORF comp21520_c0_seq1/g.29909 comp21520_c0_seq1/m.29909 type:complete len:318 (-) comp21520_c0_seq1:21-974(-)